jgi:plasmid stabilization system protein ParE
MAVRRRVVWTLAAGRTLDEAIEYVARDSPAAAADLLETALEAAGSLEWLTFRGRVVPEVGDPMLRELLVGRYRLMYLVLPESVEIVAFVHTARAFSAGH